MKTTNYKLLGILGFFVLIFGIGCNTYNGMVDMDVQVQKSWQNVEAQYQRRADLIVNIAKTVVEAAKTEENILKEVVQARASATSMNIDASKLNSDNIQQFEAAQSKLNGTLSRLMLVVERYPELKSIDQFKHLNVEITGTENRITTARTDFNEAIAKYNKKVRRFPNNILAGMFGFTEKSGFKAKAGAEEAPDLDAIYDEK
jgi:LemA protein